MWQLKVRWCISVSGFSEKWVNCNEGDHNEAWKSQEEFRKHTEEGWQPCRWESVILWVPNQIIIQVLTPEGCRRCTLRNPKEDNLGWFVEASRRNVTVTQKNMKGIHCKITFISIEAESMRRQAEVHVELYDAAYCTSLGKVRRPTKKKHNGCRNTVFLPEPQDSQQLLWMAETTHGIGFCTSMPLSCFSFCIPHTYTKV